METSDLTPSIWRTCRVLANVSRLSLLAEVIRHGPLAVSQAARLAGVTETRATLGLRALQSRGLLNSIRDSRWVRYAAVPDPLVSHAEAFLKLTTAAIERNELPPAMAKAFTAFTHPRRVRIVQVLAQAPLLVETLSVRCDISIPALHRHLAKLARRGVVATTDRYFWHLTLPDAPLPRDLVLITLQTRNRLSHTFEGVRAGDDQKCGPDSKVTPGPATLPKAPATLPAEKDSRRRTTASAETVRGMPPTPP